jgi:hypothetical protein
MSSLDIFPPRQRHRKVSDQRHHRALKQPPSAVSIRGMGGQNCHHLAFAIGHKTKVFLSNWFNLSASLAE